MVLKVYISGMSGNKEVKKRQQRVLMILDSKNINYEVIDITEPGRESDKEFMQTKSSSNGATVSDPEPRHALPPQIFNEQLYCGDYDAFDLANEIDTLEEFLKIASAAKTADSVSDVKTELTPASHVQNAAKENGEENADANADGKADENADDKPKENGENQSNGAATIADDQDENNHKPEQTSLSNESSQSIMEELEEKISREQQSANDDFNNPIEGSNEAVDANITNQSSTKQQNIDEKADEISNITSKTNDTINPDNSNTIPCGEDSVVEAILKDDDVHPPKTQSSTIFNADNILQTETDVNESSKESQLELTKTDGLDVDIEGDSVDKVPDAINLDVDIHNLNEIKDAEDNTED